MELLPTFDAAANPLAARDGPAASTRESMLWSRPTACGDGCITEGGDLMPDERLTSRGGLYDEAPAIGAVRDAHATNPREGGVKKT